MIETIVNHGWLSPEGQMHEIPYECHSDFATARGVSQETLYARGWVKLSHRSWYSDGWREDTIYVTQRQYDYIHDWHQANGRELPLGKFLVK